MKSLIEVMKKVMGIIYKYKTEQKTDSYSFFENASLI